MNYADIIKKLVNIDGDPDEELELMDYLGDGSYGVVYKALHKVTGKMVAVKLIPLAKFDHIETCIKEMEILAQCQCEYIVSYNTSYYKENNLWIVMEYCGGGSVKDIIRMKKQPFQDENMIKNLVYPILRGLQYLHSNKTIHRDIKADNILLTDNGDVKLADFGVSAKLMTTYGQKDSVIGTPFWMSPEILSRNKYTYKTDIWSIGITCIELAEGNPPFSRNFAWVAMQKIKDNPPKGLTNPENWSEEFNNFVSSCLTIDTDKRPTAQELLQHQFLQNAKEKSQQIKILVQESKELLQMERLKKVQKFQEEEEQNQSSQQEDSKMRESAEFVMNNDLESYNNTIIVHDNQTYNQGTVIRKGSVDEDDQKPSHLELYVKRYQEVNQIYDKQTQENEEIEKFRVIYKNWCKIQQDLNLDPKLEIDDVQEQVEDLKVKRDKEMQDIEAKYNPVINALQTFINLKKKVEISKKKLKKLGVQVKKDERLQDLVKPLSIKRKMKKKSTKNQQNGRNGKVKKDKKPIQELGEKKNSKKQIQSNQTKKQNKKKLKQNEFETPIDKKAKFKFLAEEDNKGFLMSFKKNMKKNHSHSKF